MKRIVVFFLMIVLVASLFHICCERDFSTFPLKKNPRELSWSIDTLAYPGSSQTWMYDIWGNSANDVYVVGHNSLNRGQMWHFNGKSWTDVKLSTTQGGNISGPIDLSSIYGFGPDDIWAVGEHIRTNPDPPPNFLDSSLLIHFDGSKWHEIETPEGRMLTVIWGSSPNNIWTAGINGTLFHYDGSTVKKDTIPLDIPKDADPFYTVLSLTGNETEAYMLLADFNSNPNRYFFLEYLGNKWVVQDSTFFFNTTSLWMSPSGTLYATGSSLYRRQGNTWDTFLDGYTTLWSYGIHGTDDNNLLVVGRSNTDDYPGTVYHYNGSNWFIYKNLENLENEYYGVWTDGDEVFITGITGSQTIVLHGK